MHRAFSLVSSPTYSIHRPKDPNGAGLVICPGGGFRDVWIDFEGHDLAIWLKDHGVTSLVLKYRTRLDSGNLQANEWQDYQRAVQADGRQAVRVLRQKASDLGLNPNTAGTVIRIPLPPLTEERRLELGKVVHNEGENSKIAIRNIRRDANHHLKELLKEKDVSEDNERKAEHAIQEVTNTAVQKVDEIVAEKEKELLEI